MRIALTVIAAMILGAWITVVFAWVDDRQRRMWHRTCTRLARHARRIKTLEERLESLAAALGYEFTVDEPPATDEIPVQPEPMPDPTVPMDLAWDAASADLTEAAAEPETEWREVNIGGQVRRFEIPRRTS